MDWNDGYVADIAYPAAFFAEQSPTHLSIACVLHGVEPVPPDRPFTYFELGAGMGLTAAVLAASHPHGRFYANDFQPAHVAAARELTERARLDNLSLLECSFADLAAGKVDLPPLDFITMYGVYSWVTPENRRAIVEFISRYLKPGGIVYVNYNAMPGWAGALPLQRLVLEHAERHPASRARQVEQARAFTAQMIDAKAGYFDGNPALRHRLASLADDKAGYLAHEYLNRGWAPLYHADVVRDMASAKLDFAGSANLAHAYPDLYLSLCQRDLLAPIDDAVMRETVKDYVHNTAFREDVMVRGARRMSPARQAEWLARLGLARISVDAPGAAAALLPPGIAAVNGETSLPALRALLAQLGSGPLSLAALAEALDLPLAQAARLGALLASSGHAAFFWCDRAIGDAAHAHALNGAIARDAMQADQYQVLASPLLGSGLRAGLVQRLTYSVLTATAQDDRDSVVQAVRTKLSSYRAAVDPQGAQAAQLAALDAKLGDTVEAILRLRVPVWRALQVL